MDNLDIYNESAIILNNKTPKSIISWITILIIFTVVICILSFVPFNIYKNINSYIIHNENGFYLKLLLKESDFPIYKNKLLYIKGDDYSYDVVEIKDNVVILKLDLKDDIKIDNNVVVANILIDRTTIFKIIKNKIKKGFGL